MGLSSNGKRLLFLAAVMGSLCACSQTTGSGTSNNQAPGAPAQQGGTQLQVVAPSQSGSSTANWGADKGGDSKAQAPMFQRGRLLNAGGGGGGGGANGNAGNAGGGGSAPAVDQYAAQYPKWRLDKAATVRSWAHVTVMPVGIDAFLKTAWTGGLVHIRLALLGPLGNLREFSRTQNSVKITFQDKVGNNIKEIIVPMSELKEAPGSENFGTPTYVVEGSMDCSLETYESIYQWVFEWQ